MQFELSAGSVYLPQYPRLPLTMACHASPPIAKSLKMNTYEKCTCNSCRMNTYKMSVFKPFRMNTCKKQGDGPPPISLRRTIESDPHSPAPRPAKESDRRAPKDLSSHLVRAVASELRPTAAGLYRIHLHRRVPSREYRISFLSATCARFAQTGLLKSVVTSFVPNNLRTLAKKIGDNIRNSAQNFLPVPTSAPARFFSRPLRYMPLLFYPSRVMRSSFSRRVRTALFLTILLIAAPGSSPVLARQENASPYAPVVTKIEPPNWWLHLTPEVMLLLSGRNLQATDVSCNLPKVIVEHTQSSFHGDYLFIWLNLAANDRSGTLLCRITTPRGKTSFELPLAPRQPTIGRFQGLSMSDVLYLIMPDRFADGDLSNAPPPSEPGTYDRSNPRAYHGGDLRGIQDHLGYLKDLGVSVLWLTPIVKNGAPQDYHGYGAVDLYSVDPHLGSLADYQNLVAAAHKLGIKIFFDFVPNHVGPLHPWVRNPPLPDWFHGSLQNHLDAASPVKPSFYGIESHEPIRNDPFEALADPHAPESLKRNLTDGWFAGALPDLNTENPDVARYLLQESIWWAESSGLDGIRVDTVPYVSRRFWSGWTSALRNIYPQLTTIGEVFHPRPEITSVFVGGKKSWDGIDTGLSTVFDYPLFFALRDVLLAGAPTGRIAGILRQDGLYPHPRDLVDFFSNHDVPRFASAPGSSPLKLELAFGLVLTLRGIPELYYGDEIGMPGGADPDNRRDFPGGWPADPHNAFLQSGRTPEQQQIFSNVRTLIHLRQEYPGLSSGGLWDLFSDDQSYVFLRQSEDDRVLVIFNNSASTRSIDVPIDYTPASGAEDFTLLYGSARLEAETNRLRIKAPAESLTIYSLN